MVWREERGQESVGVEHTKKQKQLNFGALLENFLLGSKEKIIWGTKK